MYSWERAYDRFLLVKNLTQNVGELLLHNENAKKERLRPGLIRGPVHYKCTALPLSHKAI